MKKTVGSTAFSTLSWPSLCGNTLLRNIWLIASVTFSCYAFSQPIGYNVGNANKAVQHESLATVSPLTAILMLKNEHPQAGGVTSPSHKSLIISKQKVTYVKIFVSADTSANLTEYGFIEGSSTATFRTGLLPLAQLEALARDDKVYYIEAAHTVKPLLNRAWASTPISAIHQGPDLPPSYSGQGVIVGVIDQGFDYTHPTFYDERGACRISRVWEQNAEGTPPEGYNYGRELVGNTILEAQGDIPHNSHGTSIAGIAAGSKLGPDREYGGVAYGSEIVLVSSDLSDVGIIEGIEYIMNYATAEGQPCVVNISLGDHVGPHDGTSPFDQFCDRLVGEGRLLVGAVGNEGSDSLYLEKRFTDKDTIAYTFVKFSPAEFSPFPSNTNGTGIIDIWGTADQEFSVAVSIYNTQTGAVESSIPYMSSHSSGTASYVLSDQDDPYPDECFVDIATEINPFNSKPRITLQIDNLDQDDAHRWVMIAVTGHDTRTKMWATGAQFTANGYPSPAIDGSTRSTVNEIGGTGNSIISVGAYTTKTSYTDLSSSTHNIPFYAANGAIAPFSSKGPTADNRTKPDITAPGNVVVAPVSRFDLRYTRFSREVVHATSSGAKTWYYGAIQGTSAATAAVTGTIASWLQASPNLTPWQAKKLLRYSAQQDSFTGTIAADGNNTWGWGKVDAQRGLSFMTINQEELSQDSIVTVYPNPSNGIISVKSFAENSVTARVFDLAGREVMKPKVLRRGINQIDLFDLRDGVYFFQYKWNNKIHSRKIVVKK